MSLSVLISGAADLLWSPPVLAGLILSFLLIGYRAGFPQRHIFCGMRMIPSGKSVRRSLSLNLAAVLGVGNIVGMAQAVLHGGAGAVFWCWLAGLLGVGVQYGECLFSLRYRFRDDAGRTRGGPMYAMRATGHPHLAWLYALAVCFGGLAMGAMTPANAICRTLGGTNGMLTGLLLAALTAAVILGGAGRIFSFCEAAVPFLVSFYLLSCLAVLFFCRDALPDALTLILREAFLPKSVVRGLAGFGIGRAARWGLARGLFSSESGMGTAGISAAASGQGIPAVQAMGCAGAVVWDTLILGTLTGITFVTAALWDGVQTGEPLELAASAFEHIPLLGKWVLPLCIPFFGFTTLVGWYYIAQQAFLFLSRERGSRYFSMAWIAAVITGGAASLPVVWALSDVFCMGMLLPNLSAVQTFLKHAENDRCKLALLTGRGRRTRSGENREII